MAKSFVGADEFFKSLTKSKAKPDKKASALDRCCMPKNDSPHNKKAFVFNTK